MEYGICLLPVIPLRKEPSDRSEMLTQILFGETVRIYDISAKWIGLETDLDHYPGWADVKQIVQISETEYRNILNKKAFLSTRPSISSMSYGSHGILMPACSCFPGLSDGVIELAGNRFLFSGEFRAFEKGTAEDIVEAALGYLDSPYLWGGRTHLGIDCSGLTQAAYRLNGINIPRDASRQAGVGETVGFLSEARPGDLAFFDDAQGYIIHVGMIKDPTTIIHASGKVRLDTIDHQGIFNIGTRSYTHSLRLIRRILK